MKHLKLLFIAIYLFNLNGYGQTVSNKTDTQKVKVIGHAHMDPVYRWRWNEIETREIYKTFSDVLNTLDKYPELHFAQSYLLYYSTIQKRFPALFEEVKHSINNKRWSVVGGQWVEPDETLSSGESLIRQFFSANRTADYMNQDIEMCIYLDNTGEYGFTINEGILTMSVVRGARDMDPRMDEGKHSFPLEKSFFNIKSDHIIISSLKTKQDAYELNPLILRIVETEGRDEDVSVQLPYNAVSVTECNHLEHAIEPRSEIKIQEKQFSFKMGHDQIRTFMIEF
ncbi:MAG TPA: glycosyl hydrolase-related protein [Bacteroidales bacterium]|nr:glycosyl hydrolase-related protein [Bacteroidales bacterium]